jgi:microcystin-dependent protein
MHFGTGPDGVTYQQAEAAGVESVTLTIQQIPSHTHTILASTDPGNTLTPAGNVLAALSPVSVYKPNLAAPNLAMNASSVTPVGGSQPHDNMQPFLCINYIISLFGIFPSQT